MAVNPFGIKFLLIFLVCWSFLLACGCDNSISANEKRDGNSVMLTLGSDDTKHINYRSFQNSDKTWGFTIFINSMPFRQYNRIPYKRISNGFVSREEAESVANLFVRLIHEGVQSPKLDKNSVDTLDITLYKMKMHHPVALD